MPLMGQGIHKTGRERSVVSQQEGEQILAGHLQTGRRRECVCEEYTEKELTALRSRRGKDGVGN